MRVVVAPTIFPSRRLRWACLSLLLSGCVFYDLELDPCRDAEPPSGCMTGQGSGGTQSPSPSGGGGTKAAPPPGGEGGEGNGGTQEQMGGTAGAVGGQTDQGSGGGGDGGAVATGGGGGGGGRSTEAGLRINEVKVSGGRFLELYNVGSALVLAGQVTVWSSANAGQLVSCPLPVDVAPRATLVLVPEGVSCPVASSACFACSLEISSGLPAPTVSLVDGAGLELQVVQHPEQTDVGAPLSTQSWAAIPDGSDAFRSAPPSPGALNSQR